MRMRHENLRVNNWKEKKIEKKKIGKKRKE
jgi:hypothetical protein